MMKRARRIDYLMVIAVVLLILTDIGRFQSGELPSGTTSAHAQQRPTLPPERPTVAPTKPPRDREPTSTPEATATPETTATPEPTVAPLATDVATATSEPSPTAVPMPIVLPGTGAADTHWNGVLAAGLALCIAGGLIGWLQRYTRRR